MPTMANNDVHCADTENGQTDMHFNFLTFAMLLSRVYLPAKVLMAVVKHARIQREAGGPDLLKNHKSIWFPSNTGPDPLKNHKATKPDSMLGRHRHASKTPFGPMMTHY